MTKSLFGIAFSSLLLLALAGSQSRIPEPATMALFGAALIGLGVLGRKRVRR